MLEWIAGASSAKAPLTDATCAIAAAVLDVAEVIEGVARTLGDGFEFTATVAAHIARLASAASELAHTVVAAGALTAAVLCIVEVLERVAGAQAVVACLTLRAGAAAATVSAVGLVLVWVARAR
ncbi:MAG: hypothetical protein R3F65_05115 [bacterium]